MWNRADCCGNRLRGFEANANTNADPGPDFLHNANVALLLPLPQTVLPLAIPAPLQVLLPPTVPLKCTPIQPLTPNPDLKLYPNPAPNS